MYMELTSNINWNQKFCLIDYFKLFVACTTWRIPGTVGTVLLTAISLESLNRFMTISKNQH